VNLGYVKVCTNMYKVMKHMNMNLDACLFVMHIVGRMEVLPVLWFADAFKLSDI